ncbi:MAG: hypothetical protein AAB567_00550 [Patescibacteria group bacterium]
MVFYFILFVLSGLLLFWSANLLVRGITELARYLQWREFVIAFFVMAVASSFPNLFVGILSVAHGIPELSLGDIMGNSLVDLTLVVALAVFFGKNLITEGKLIQISSVFTLGVAILPLLLILDGQLNRGDGLVLLVIFLLYSRWLFSKRKEHPEIFNHAQRAFAQTPLKGFLVFLRSLLGILTGIVILLFAAEGVVQSAFFFARTFHFPLPIIGLLIVGLGSALPEIYLTIISARKNKDRVILGELMGAVIVMTTLILGIVALLHPIEIENFSPFALARAFLVISALVFFLAVKTDHKISKGEAFFLLLLYITFVGAELLLRSPEDMIP